MTDNETVENKVIDHQVENIDTSGEIAFCELTIPGDNSDCDILYKEHDTIYFNDIVWVKVNK